MGKYIVKDGEIHHNGEKYFPGDEIELTGKEAQSLPVVPKKKAKAASGNENTSTDAGEDPEKDKVE